MNPEDSARREWLEEILEEWKARTRDPRDGERFAARVLLLFDGMSAEADKKRLEGMRYARFSRPVDAIQAMLSEEDHALEPEVIKARLLEGGFTGGDEDIEQIKTKIDRSVNAYRPEAKNTRTALRFGPEGSWNLVGLGDWPDSKFTR